MRRLQGERTSVGRMRADLEKAALRLEQEKNAWQKMTVRGLSLGSGYLRLHWHNFEAFASRHIPLLTRWC